MKRGCKLIWPWETLQGEIRRTSRKLQSAAQHNWAMFVESTFPRVFFFPPSSSADDEEKASFVSSLITRPILLSSCRRRRPTEPIQLRSISLGLRQERKKTAACPFPLRFKCKLVRFLQRPLCPLLASPSLARAARKGGKKFRLKRKQEQLCEFVSAGRARDSPREYTQGFFIWDKQMPKKEAREEGE